MRTHSVVAVVAIAVLTVGCAGGDDEGTPSSAATTSTAATTASTTSSTTVSTTSSTTIAAPITAQEAPSSSSPTVVTTPLSLSGGLDLQARSVLGFAPGNLNPLDPDDLLAALTPTLGEPTRDTGWYMLPGGEEGDCPGGIPQRVIRWGDLGFAFWNQQDVVNLWSWTLGDPAASFKGDRKEPTPIPMTPTLPLSSLEGLVVGSSVAELVHIIGPDLILIDDEGNPASPESATLGYQSGFDAQVANLGFALSDGRVTGISATLSFC